MNETRKKRAGPAFLLVCVCMAIVAMFGTTTVSAGGHPPAWPKAWPYLDFYPPPGDPPTDPPCQLPWPRAIFTLDFGWNLIPISCYWTPMLKAHDLCNLIFRWNGYQIGAFQNVVDMVNDPWTNLSYIHGATPESGNFTLYTGHSFWVHSAFQPSENYTDPSNHNYLCLPMGLASSSLHASGFYCPGWYSVAAYGYDPWYTANWHTPSDMASGLAQHLRYNDGNQWLPYPKESLLIYGFNAETQQWIGPCMWLNNHWVGDFVIGYQSVGVPNTGIFIDLISPGIGWGAFWDWAIR